MSNNTSENNGSTFNDLLTYFETHFDDLLMEYDGKVLVISKSKKITPFDSFDEGCKFGLSEYGYGNYLIKKCSRSAHSMVYVVNPIISIV